MRKLMREHRTEFRDIQNKKQRETDAHDPPASKTERAATICDKGVRLPDEVDLTRNLFIQSTGDLINFTEEFGLRGAVERSEEHTSELQSQSNLVCRLLLEKKN